MAPGTAYAKPMQPGATLIFLDANVLYSRTLRDWFSLIALDSGVEGLTLRWSEDVMTEFIYNRRRANPAASDSDIGRLRKVLTETFPEAMISGYRIHPSLVEGKDKFDAHVLAAAAHGNVDYLVTANYKDFEQFAESFEFEIFLPDDMLCLIEERRPDAVQSAILKQGSYWGARPGSKKLPEALADAGAPNFAALVRAKLSRMALSGRY